MNLAGGTLYVQDGGGKLLELGPIEGANLQACVDFETSEVAFDHRGLGTIQFTITKTLSKREWRRLSIVIDGPREHCYKSSDVGEWKKRRMLARTSRAMKARQRRGAK